MEKVPYTIGRPDSRLEAITAWLPDNELEGVSGRVSAVEVSYTELESNVERRLRELTTEIAASQAAGALNFAGFASGPQTHRDRNVSDPRDYKLADLGVKPSMARWKKWRRDLEGFIDTIGLSWKHQRSTAQTSTQGEGVRELAAGGGDPEGQGQRRQVPGCVRLRHTTRRRTSCTGF